MRLFNVESKKAIRISVHFLGSIASLDRWPTERRRAYPEWLGLVSRCPCSRFQSPHWILVISVQPYKQTACLTTLKGSQNIEIYVFFPGRNLVDVGVGS